MTGTLIYVLFLLSLSEFSNSTDYSNFLQYRTYTNRDEPLISNELKQGLYKGQIYRRIVIDRNELQHLPCESVIEMWRVEDSLYQAQYEHEIELVILRYQKGIELLKMVYEKILSLDHHFTSLSTYQDLASMSNPNNYPQFAGIKDQLKSKTKSKHRIQLPDLLDNNSLFSMGYALIYSFFGTDGKKDRQQTLEDISCLLDFTLSMHTDLKIIYYETDYLRIQNTDLKEACFELFDSYTKMIEYKYGLEYCRSQDEWDKIDALTDELKFELINMRIDDDRLTMMNKMRFAVDLLLEFIDQYARFVYMGDMHYKKFLGIIHNYQHRDYCVESLPEQYIRLEQEVKNSIQKFETAYNVVELKGSKMRDLLYGF